MHMLGSIRKKISNNNTHVVTRLYKNKEQVDMVERPIHDEKKQVLCKLVLRSQHECFMFCYTTK